MTPDQNDNQVNPFKDQFKKADEAFAEQYKANLDKLKGFSEAEFNSVTPVTSDIQTYKKLIDLVDKAAADNISQADLIDKIRSLGDLAIKIAKKIPDFAKLL